MQGKIRKTSIDKYNTTFLTILMELSNSAIQKMVIKDGVTYSDRKVNVTKIVIKK